MVRGDWYVFLGGIGSEIDGGMGGMVGSKSHRFGLSEFRFSGSAHHPHLTQWLKERHKAEQNM